MALKHEKHELQFRNIEENDQLVSFLSQRALSHNYFFHYTDLDTLNKLLEGKMLHLSRSDTLNDFREGEYAAEKENVYIASFSFGNVETENIAMWSMYAFPYNKGVRMKINGNTMRAAVNSFNDSPVFFKANTQGGQPEPLSFFGQVELSIVDVVYVDEKSSLFYFSKKNSNSGLLQDIQEKISKTSILNWCVKDAIWKTENETRLILKLDKSLPNNIKKVAIDFSKALQKLEITCGPCVESSIVKNSIKYQGAIKIVPSKYYNGTYFKSCKREDCNNPTSFCKNRNQR